MAAPCPASPGRGQGDDGRRQSRRRAVAPGGAGQDSPPASFTYIDQSRSAAEVLQGVIAGTPTRAPAAEKQKRFRVNGPGGHMPKPDRDPAIVRAIAIAWLALML